MDFHIFNVERIHNYLRIRGAEITNHVRIQMYVKITLATFPGGASLWIHSYVCLNKVIEVIGNLNSVQDCIKNTCEAV